MLTKLIARDLRVAEALKDNVTRDAILKVYIFGDVESILKTVHRARLANRAHIPSGTFETVSGIRKMRG